MKTLLRLLLKSQHQQNRSRPDQIEKGMTLVELLVGAIMAFLIITPMLAFVVDMLNTDRREQVKANTDQDIQAAVDFIAQDLSQAIYIYDNDGVNAIKAFLPPTVTGEDKTPILVFWKRQLLKNSLPVNSLTPLPKDCDPNAVPGAKGDCNDTYVLSLVAYYQFKNKDDTWCQPSGVLCPTRIARYQIQDGLRDSNGVPYSAPAVSKAQEISGAYNVGTPSNTPPAFDIAKPLENVTTKATWGVAEVLVNYIDHNKVSLAGTECKIALGNPTDPKDTTKSLEETTLQLSDQDTNSFYACVDTAKNIARVTIRGNSLRRLQADAPYNPKSPAFFPTATVQVQGLGGLGK
ncbi:hormogonium polysaccharide secretion pseudopilin HpsC [Microcoleus sp. B4-D4]|uniref:hormogonium polysaccharide secretion pseudopilin HpsC n=1 Tax=Microcoleus sp. B4-D4 TaxID=2818667 RepID=UPI002FD3DABB